MKPRLCSPLRRSADISQTTLSGIPHAFCYDGAFTRGIYVSPAYRRLISLLGLGEQTIALRFRGYREYHHPPMKDCPVRIIYRPVLDVGKFHPYQSERHVNRAVSRVLERLDKIAERSGADYLICVDLTVPGWLSHELAESPREGIRVLREAVNEFIGLLHRNLFRGKTSQFGGFCSIHVWKTRSPLEPHFHVHLQLINVAAEKNNETFSLFYRFRPVLSETIVKRVWFSVLQRRFAVREKPDIHLHYIRLKDRARLIHRIKYVFRRPLVDLNESLDCGFDGMDRKWADFLLRYTPRVALFGFFTCLRKVGIAVNSSKSAFHCPVCGAAMMRGRLLKSHLPDVPHCVLMRDGKLGKIPPPIALKIVNEIAKTGGDGYGV